MMANGPESALASPDNAAPVVPMRVIQLCINTKRNGRNWPTIANSG
jgi:hypothetical protein